MEKLSIYEDIATRTEGDIYMGVVGPVRAGKSTFITQFMQSLVIPNISNKNSRERAIDELPQSADGKTVMTTQPKFVPNEAVKVKLNGNVHMNVRMIDCVGYLVEGALGHKENEKSRLVKTPWSTQSMPFEQAAELGTRKVIQDHSTIAVLMTTDGSISDIPRSSYVTAEEQIVKELKQSSKPFAIVINSKNPKSDEVKNLAKSLSQKYGSKVLAVDALNLSEENIKDIFAVILEEFPIESVQIKIPKWMQALAFEDEIIQSIINEITAFAGDSNKIGDISHGTTIFNDNENFDPVKIDSVSMGQGRVIIEVKAKEFLFYKILSSQVGEQINDDFHLISYMKQLSHSKKQFDRIKNALEQVEQTGYGVVMPTEDQMILEEPQMVKKGTSYGVRLKANAPCLHIVKVDVETEINPLVGTESQSLDLINYLMKECETDPKALWKANIFGRSMSSLVIDGINGKAISMPFEVQKKIKRTIGRIVNEGKGGIICILL